MYGSKEIDGKCLKFILNIRELTLIDCEYICDDHLRYLENIHSLRFNYVPSISDKVLLYLKTFIRYHYMAIIKLLT
mgnify:FL=1